MSIFHFLTPTQRNVLRLVLSNPGISQREIITSVGNRSTAQHAIYIFEDSGIIRTKILPGNKRSYKVDFRKLRKYNKKV